MNIHSSPRGDDHRESADGYLGELFRKGRYRVALCRDGIQWLLQRRRPQVSPGGAAWDNIAYCQTKKALARLYREHTGQNAAELALLPACIPNSDYHIKSKG